MTPPLSPEALRLSGELARELGQLPVVVRRDDIEGFVAETYVPSSRDRPDYRLLLSIGGRWCHADARCEGWTNWGRCHHVSELERIWSYMSESQEIVVYNNPLALVDKLSVTEVIEGFTAVGEWRYSFENRGVTVTGLSADGVQDGVRQLSRKGEAIRTVEVRMEKETETEAFFVARAVRYAVSPDGIEIPLDSTIRGKRVAKTNNPHWFEHGITKAARNAEEALMPEALKQWMLQQAGAVKAATTQRVQPTRQQQRPQHGAQQQEGSTAPSAGQASSPGQQTASATPAAAPPTHEATQGMAGSDGQSARASEAATTARPASSPDPRTRADIAREWHDQITERSGSSILSRSALQAHSKRYADHALTDGRLDYDLLTEQEWQTVLAELRERAGE